MNDKATDEDILHWAENCLDFGNADLPSDKKIQMSIACSLLVIARNGLPVIVEQRIEQAEPGFRQAAIDSEIRRRVAEYQKFWNPKTGKFEIDKGTENEWICTVDELYADVRKSVEWENS